jgi:flavin reductase (DIM6/NTAB) family NADH-FMN oxidoreductase RutF
MNVKPSEIPHSDLYGILINSVAPRPIAWVSTVSAAGQPNLAPFSFFNAMSVSPPLLGFSPGLRSPTAGDGPGAPKDDAPKDGVPKDTLRNVRETKEFVVNIVTYDLLRAMNITSGDYAPSVNEFDLAKVTPAPSTLVRPARVAESPVSFECKLHKILDFSPAPTGSSLVIGEIVCIHLDDAYIKEGKLDRDLLDLIGRMGGMQYTRTTERIELARPNV